MPKPAMKKSLLYGFGGSKNLGHSSQVVMRASINDDLNVSSVSDNEEIVEKSKFKPV
jgi:hypothetical protein